MSLVIRMSELEREIMVSLECRDIEWADRICTKSKLVHWELWRIYPEAAYVKSDVLPLLERTQQELRSMLHTGDSDASTELRLQRFIKNVGLRIVNVKQNYLAGKPSDLAAGERLQSYREDTQ